MDEADDDRSRSPAARMKWSFLNGPKQTIRAKLDRQWARKLRQTVREQDALTDAEEVEKAESAANEIMAVAANLVRQLRGQARMSLAFYEMACAGAPNRQIGRPSTHDPDHLADLERMVLMSEGICGRRKAISEVLANEPREHRAALRNYLHRRLQPVRTKSWARTNRA